MQQLIDRVAEAAGIDTDLAEKAVGMTLALIRKQGDEGKVDALFKNSRERRKWRQVTATKVPERPAFSERSVV